MEQAMGVEPTSEAWEASILPINYACIFAIIRLYTEGKDLSRGDAAKRKFFYAWAESYFLFERISVIMIQ